MIDLHTHILPCMDDGAPNVQTALAMLEAERKQGVDTVALTPHYYPSRESVTQFLTRRDEAYASLCEQLDAETSPKLLLGAEVAWAPGMEEWPELQQLCYEGTNILLVELPFAPWTDALFHQLYAMESKRGVLPMIAHIERYFFCQEKSKIAALMQLELPMQVSAAELGSLFGRRRAMRLIEAGGILISDCHSLTHRPPNIGKGMEILRKRRGEEFAQAVGEIADNALYD